MSRHKGVSFPKRTNIDLIEQSLFGLPSRQNDRDSDSPTRSRPWIGPLLPMNVAESV